VNTIGNVEGERVGRRCESSRFTTKLSAQAWVTRIHGFVQC